MERMTRHNADGAVALNCSENKAIDRLASYEDSGMTPEEIDRMVADLNYARAGYEKYYQAEQDGRLVMLDQETACAVAAGLAAIQNNKRLLGVTFVYDVFGEAGGPYEITYHHAAEILCKIWNAFPLHAEAALKERGNEP